MNIEPSLRLGLIGDNIDQSQSPRLHRLAGLQHDLTVTYDRLVPAKTNETFEQVFARCQSSGYRGINVTYPYKERVVPALRIDDPLVRAIGAVNTVVFGTHGPTGYNTDYTGFMAAYDHVRHGADTGPVLMIGTGGVGRAVAFGLLALGANDIRLVDHDLRKAEILAEALRRAAPDIKVTVSDNPSHAAVGAVGLINCTPVGMVGNEGTPLPNDRMCDAKWAFDAVYTPVRTQFINDAEARSLVIISGWELFFFQGIQAWSIFSDLAADENSLRSSLLIEGRPQ
jgi:shikimate dehydrogenase